ncbi:zinc finger lsd1 subclass family protein (macronuclear) [Tetrahymena thermophila SB210]|uniref:Zinc finger lsd1 subclass family protein n=1 Tax=Tetrahymena thermophila (strain SB210) TaxID=312017 RepID=Q23JB7_TETTS|nr:zinc finger lsd1 subclass family protein [Tetrahymena thermophila SB210]EAR96587.3 zinc finger lsd1 subclass family protein [Tetrahymena thermophila SB210]|eukprot:XP_001016832.3 zinc finger lsd1 subclass family protein [Tetrahymena thermophila SB210]
MIFLLIVLNLIAYTLQDKNVSLRSNAIVQVTSSKQQTKSRKLASLCNQNCTCGPGFAYPQCGYCQNGLIYYPTNNTCQNSNICRSTPGMLIDNNNGGTQTCTQCITGYQLIGSLCYQNCPSGTYRYPDLSCKSCNTSNKQYIDGQNYCQQCDSSCQTCNGSSQNNCQSCPFGTSLYPDGSCKICNLDNKQYLDSSQICQNCNSSCQTCDGSSQNQCLSCPSGTNLYPDRSCKFCDLTNKQFLDTHHICQSCDSSCQQCSGPSSIQCISCPSGTNLFPDNSCRFCDKANKKYLDSSNVCRDCDQTCQTCSGPTTTQCLTCTSGTNFYPDKTCRFCDIANKQYLDSSNICQQCDVTCQTCNGSAPTSCLTCPNGTSLYPDRSCKVCNTSNKQYIDSQQSCQYCDSSCQTCDGSSPDNCLSCPSGYFKQGNKCIQCNAACKECIGTSDQDCIECNQLYFQFDKNTKICQKCPNDQYLKYSNQSCSNCDYQCIPCNSIPLTFSMFQIDSNLSSSQDYCLVCSCKQCLSGYVKFNDQQCIASCDEIGSNYQYDSSTNSCQCQPGYNYQVKNPIKNNFDCAQGYGQGYYCNDSNKCFQCSQNCSQCSDIQTCQKCGKGFYLWKNNCYSSCFPDLNIVPNENSGECECTQGYFLQKLSTPIQNQFDSCQLVLALQEIQIHNKLMESQDQTLSSNFYDNLIVFQYNRELTKEEYQSFQFQIDDEILNQGSDFQIISTSQQMQNILCTVRSAQNRKIKQLRIQLLNSIQNYQIQNTILVSNEYSKQSSDALSSKQISQSFESMSQTFSGDQNSATGKTISFLKQFQVLCYISNFVQILPLIYLIRDKLPDKIKFSSLFGVSIIFNKTPPPSQITISSLEISTNDYTEQLKNTLQQFGISSNFYENFLQAHLLITISIRESFCFKKYQIFMEILNLL